MTDKISDNVGKKIVEALKMHNSTVDESLNTDKKNCSVNESVISDETVNKDTFNSFNNQAFTQNVPEINNVNIDSLGISDNNGDQMNINSILQNAINQNIGNIGLFDVQSDFEYPNNVAILNHLIAKLPAGVTKQTGAIIIKQTMEALGIPMKSVLREAQQVQDSLATRTKECQRNIIECRKQIATLEIKVQQYQRQAVVMNDVINLFMSTGV